MSTLRAGELGLRGLLEQARAGLRSQVLYAANAIGLFNHLSLQPQSARALAEKTSLDQLAIERLLDSCVAVGLLRKTDGHYANSTTAETFLVAGKPDYIGDAVDMFRWRVAPRWNDLEASLRGHRPQNMYDELLGRPEQLERFLVSLRQLAVWRARALAMRLDFSSFRRLLDLGAGSGVYSAEILKRSPALRAYLFDQPRVCEILRRLMAETGLSERVEIVAGDFFHDELPRADLVLFSNVLHDFPVEQAKRLVARAFDALEPGGAILINDFILDESKTAPVDGALMSLVLFLETDGAGNYSAQEYSDWLAAAGFREVEAVTLHEAERIVRARKPAVEAARGG
jgi:3-hydroxy-5-methyl-1-naphthoate 3-O-methyltransferase